MEPLASCEHQSLLMADDSVIKYCASPSSVEKEIVPERGLLAAVLERAVRDLNKNVGKDDRKDALKWFHGYSDGEGFTYNDCIEGLNLGCRELQIIKLKIKIAEKYEEERVLKELTDKCIT